MRQLSIILFIFCLAASVSAETEDAVFAILKLSYNTPGETPVSGGICGTAFLINNKTILTVNHGWNEFTEPNKGFKYVQLWLLKRGKEKIIIPFENATFKHFPDIDTTIITIKQPLATTEKIDIQNNSPSIGDAVYGLGHVGSSMPKINSSWQNNALKIHDYSFLNNNKSDKTGLIIAIEQKTTPPKSDVKIRNILTIEPSFVAVKGMSGGPLISKKNNKLVGLMSFGLPEGTDNKLSTFAIAISEIIVRIPASDF